jgi:hypothetical protein
MQKRLVYRAYLVRLWPTQRAGVADYRVTVQSVATGERRHFPDLEGLLTFWRTLRVSPDSSGPGSDREGACSEEERR